MVDLPHRFVPTSSQFISPVRIVMQNGHDDAIVAVAFSPCERFCASADAHREVKIWALETLDVLGTYLLEFDCTALEWDASDALVCTGTNEKRLITFLENGENAKSEALDDFSGRIIRLLGAPEAEAEGDVLRIHYQDNVFEHVVPGLIHYQMDPCERYVIAHAPNRITVFSAFDDSEIMRLDAVAGHVWCGMHLSSRGDACTVLADDGAIWWIDPIKKSSQCLMAGKTHVCASDFGGDRWVLYGDNRGNLTIYDMQEKTLVLRTPRRAREFCAMYPASEKSGFVALRSESATAFFSHSQEILSAAPLPGAWRASCAGSLFSEVIVACSDHVIYRLKLDENTITRCTRVDKEVDALACTWSNLLIHHTDGNMSFHDGNKMLAMDWLVPEKPLAMAISENGKNLAVLTSNGIEIRDRAGKLNQNIQISGVGQMIFGKEKSANQLLLFMHDLRIMTMDIRTCEITELNRLSIEHARLVSVASCAKSYCSVLLDTEHGQRMVLKVGLNSGKSSIALRVFATGTQIWGAATDEQSVYARTDATALRIISGLKAFSLEDWTRSEPLGKY